MEQREIEQVYSRTKSAIKEERLQAMVKLQQHYNEKRKDIGEKLEVNRKGYALYLSNQIKEHAKFKLDNIVKMQSEDPKVVQQAKIDAIKQKAKFETERLKMKTDKNILEQKYIGEYDHIKDEYNNELGRIRIEAKDKLDTARKKFDLDMEEYRAWQKAQNEMQQLQEYTQEETGGMIIH